MSEMVVKKDFGRDPDVKVEGKFIRLTLSTGVAYHLSEEEGRLRLLKVPNDIGSSSISIHPESSNGVSIG